MELNFNHSYENSKEHHEAGDHLKAFQELSQVMEYPGFMHGEGEWLLGWQLLGSIAGAMGFERLSHLAIRAGDLPHDPKVLYNLGYELVEVDLPKIAATPLNQAHLMCPDNEAILTELSAAFENSGCYDLAYMNLASSGAILEESYMCRYLLAFNAIMSGHLKECKAAFPGLDNPPDDNFAFMRDRIARFLARAEALADLERLDNSDLRGWHHVLSASLLLHLSPYGFDAPMRGRYAFVQDNLELVRTGLQRLLAAVQTWNLDLQQVICWEDRESKIIGAAFAKLSGLPLRSWDEVPADAPGLYVAYDLQKTSSEFLQRFLDRKPGQWLWGHALQWTEDFPIAADFVTFMYQHNSSPWDSKMRFDEEKQEMVTDPPVKADEDKLVAELLATEVEDNPVDGMEEFLAFVQTIGPLVDSGRREKYFQGSPVRSNRFQ